MLKAQKPAKVYLVGAGPGDPGLMTVKALECVKQADVILYDRLISPEILKQGKAGAVLKYVGKAKGESVDQAKINQTILSYARAGKTVVRLKGGDPFIFGRGQEEAFFLNNQGIACAVIPGVSSFYAVPEVCGIPLTYRGIASQFMVLTGHEDPAKQTPGIDWRHAGRFQGTIVVMMGLSNLGKITSRLMAAGKSGDTPAAVIASGTTRREKIVISRLSDIAAKTKNFTAPAICVIGGVVKMAYGINDRLRPLAGKRYLSTASEALGADIVRQLKRLGAAVSLLPMIHIVANPDTAVLDRIITQVKTFDWLVFTSRHGVDYFLKRYFELGANPAHLAGRIACVGCGTAAEFAKHGMAADLMPEEFTTRNLGLALAAQGIAGKRVALLRTPLAQDVLKKILLKAGAVITDCAVYHVENVGYSGPRLAPAVKKLDGIFFLSPQAVRVFFATVPPESQAALKQKAAFYSIGPVTTRMLKKIGARDIRAAAEHTVNGMVDRCLKDIV
ncbi:MAG: uroporphyrinogen-III C-methyltransferase [Candidatus Omnitrophica bacterium]|nr:uroporphyrinogen-III C-methyltransferase [Candidatus Omnitrophota bacterium]